MRCPKCCTDYIQKIESKRLDKVTISFIATCENHHKYGWCERIVSEKEKV